jgi:transposase
MIRTKTPDVRLFYGSEELYRPASTNFYARLNSVVGVWSVLCAPLRSVFSQSREGRPVDHVVYFKIFLIGYLEGIIFDTDLAERIADSLAIREFLGYGPCERTPDHSSIGRVRAQFAAGEQLEQVFNSVVALCAKQGLVGGERTSVDSTLLPANASLSSLECVTTKLSVGEHLKRAREAGQKLAVSNKDFTCTSDPEARIAKKGTNCPRGMYHKATCVTDSKSQIILAAHVCQADLNDATAAIPALEHAKEVLESNDLKLTTVVADAGYDECNFHALVEDLGATPITNYTTNKNHKPEGFTKESFEYDAERKVYICPNKAILKPQKPQKNCTPYRAKVKDCAGCPFKDLCLDGKAKIRTISRHKNEDARLRNIDRCHTDEGREALKERKTVVEPPFGHMKRFGGLELVNCRGTDQAEVKFVMGAMAWNLLKLAKKAGKTLLNRIFDTNLALRIAILKLNQTIAARSCNVKA